VGALRDLARWSLSLIGLLSHASARPEPILGWQRDVGPSRSCRRCRRPVPGGSSGLSVVPTWSPLVLVWSCGQPVLLPMRLCLPGAVASRSGSPRTASQEAGELTPTLKAKRDVINRNYAAQLDALCAEMSSGGGRWVGPPRPRWAKPVENRNTRPSIPALSGRRRLPVSMPRLRAEFGVCGRVRRSTQKTDTTRRAGGKQCLH
jgi:hypothetical protein